MLPSLLPKLSLSVREKVNGYLSPCPSVPSSHTVTDGDRQQLPWTHKEEVGKENKRMDRLYKHFSICEFLRQHP